MQKKLTKHGNSLALVIEKPVLELLGIDADTPLSITTDGRCLIIAPQPSDARSKRLRQGMDRMHKKYGRMLKRLAE
jgi:antitoxin component of MazEF toxin-antitoxin module